MLVTGAGRPAAAAPRTDKTEDRMVIGQGWNAGRPLMAGAPLNGGSWNEPTSTPTNTWEVAPLNQPPDR